MGTSLLVDINNITDIRTAKYEEGRVNMGRRSDSWIDLFSVFPWWMNAILGFAAYVFLTDMAPHIQTDNRIAAVLIKNSPAFAPIAVLIFGAAGVISFFRSLSGIRAARPLSHHLFALPWWVNLLVAVLVYVALVKIIPGMSFDNRFAVSLSRMGPTFGKVFSILFLIAASVSGARQLWGKRLFSRNRTIREVKDLSWQDFESYVAEHYRQQGFAVTEAGRGGADDGMDLILKRDGKVFIVECKQWRTQQVGVKIVDKLARVISAKGATGGILVTTGGYTAEAKSRARETAIELVDGNRLLGSQVAQPAADQWPLSAAPACPKCGGTMRRKIARRGKHDGESFWGCSAYPKCHGIVDIV